MDGGLIGEWGSEEIEESMFVVIIFVVGFFEFWFEGKFRFKDFFGGVLFFILLILRNMFVNGWNCGF